MSPLGGIKLINFVWDFCHPFKLKKTSAVVRMLRVRRADFGSTGAMFVLRTSLIPKEQSRLEIQVSQRRLQTSFFQVFGFYSYKAIKCNLEE